MITGALLAIALLAALIGLGLGIQNWEFRRLLLSRMRERLVPHDNAHVAVIVPVKGSDIGLEENLGSLFHQDYDDYEIIFVVESRNDSSYAVIRRLIDAAPDVSAKLVVAGRADESGQKIHNLLAATEQLDDKVAVLAFADADARPPRRWLKTLSHRLVLPEIGVTTGYRWFTPQRQSLANLLVTSVNAGAASLLGRHEFNLVWGGSWAISRERFETLDLRGAWRECLSDDLVARRVMRKAKLHVLFEPSCICGSPVDVNWREMLEFVRRQIIIGKRYASMHWLTTLIMTTITQVAFWGNALAACLLLASRHETGWLHAGAAFLLFGGGAVRAWLRQDAIRRRFPEYETVLLTSRRFDIWAGILISSLTWLLLLSTIFSSKIRWRGNDYQILRGGKIRALGSSAATRQPVRPVPRKSGRESFIPAR